ncbi:hypothetical protein NCAS_0J02200 [Naumovozyma castellii]|uniref:TATA element modulatory factor 1 TATA binding domain-containing protein n=1 Tax=Naumovozyma castellii TaxID=27288 RepID=G0VL10_NAUCA|nr:hypothetical protein NCAS_0J02200 [Naumovozyma castellii CBS 4309]CCC72199.1 hypothetical protein NCAS_0J02200 [Naumovozyma castellii CBS 4309]
MPDHRKKLSLEERLSLATKKGKKKGKKSNLNSPSITATSSPQLNASEFVPTENNKSIESTISPIQSSLDLQQNTPHKDDATITEHAKPTIETWLPNNYEELDVESLLNQLRPYLTDIIKENESLKIQVNENSAQSPPIPDSSLFRLIKEKDDIINQLRTEGENLSKSDFRKSTELKSLKNEYTDLQTQLTAAKNDLEEKDIDLKNIKMANASLEKSLTESTVKISSLLKETDELAHLQSQLNEKDVKINELTEKLTSSTTSLNDTILNHQSEIDSLKKTNNDHILTLESTIEKLRIELENVNDEITSTNILGNPIRTNTQDTTGHPRDQYEILQNQFKSSKENWESIEFSLNSKITNLNSTLNDSKKDIVKLNKDLEQLRTEKTKLVKQLNNEREQNEELKEQIKNLNLKIDNLNNALHTRTEDYSLLQKKFNIQKSQLQNNIGTQEVPSNSGELLIPKNKNYSISSKISSDSLMRNLQEEWLNSDIPFGGNPDNNSDLENDNLDNIDNSVILHTDDKEGSVSPTNSVECLNDSITQESGHNNKQLPVLELGEVPEEAADLESMFQRTPSSQIPLSLRKTSTALLSNASNTQMNSQMMSRLGSEIRRIEGEYAALEETYTRLKKEKDNANDEILRLLEENEGVKSIKEENLKLKTQIESVNQKLETALQLLGEKTEAAEELQNDVEDLKEMLHQQVQQMVEMQQRLL